MPQPNIRRFLKHGTLPQLRIFEASARLGNFTRAAQELHMAQPTASVQIKKLSETVGLPLFEQVGRRIYLTEAGRRVYAGCGDIFRAISNLEEALNEMRGLTSGHLRLAATTTAKYFVPRFCPSVRRRPVPRRTWIGRLSPAVSTLRPRPISSSREPAWSWT